MLGNFYGLLDDWRRAVSAFVPARLREFIEQEIALPLSQAGFTRKHGGAIAFVIVLHFLFLWLIVLSLRSPSNHVASGELHVVFFRTMEKVAPPRVDIPDPEPTVIEPPQIVIADDQPATMPAAYTSMVLAPRPDPGHANMPPMASAAEGALIVVLKILVKADGTVAQTTVVRSSGHPDADMTASDFVRTNWRFLPALLNGNAIQYWTTVAVAFKAAG